MLLALAPLSSSDGSHAPARHLEFGGLQVLQQRHARQLEAEGAAGCVDASEHCAGWAAAGECEANPDFMRHDCAASCHACGASAHAPATPVRQGCSDDPAEGCRSREAAGECVSNKTAMLLACPAACGLCRMGSSLWVSMQAAFDCGDKDPLCSRWAEAGECTKNPQFMSDSCATSCRTCAQKRTACDVPPDTPPLVGPGGISQTMERILAEFPQYKPRALSRPGAGPKGADSPWVIALEGFVSGSEAEAFISGCAAHFDRSLAGDQLSPVRTSTQCWCSNNECSADPRTAAVERRISNLTRAPVRYMEPFQILKYEPGQFYKVHHDQNSGLFTPQGPRVYTFFMYLSTPAEGGGTRFADLDVVMPAVKGNAVIWPSIMDASPSRDEPYTNHEAQPTTVGRKYASNVWVHQFDYRTPADKGCLLTHKNTH